MSTGKFITLEIRSVHKRFGTVKAVDNVSLSAEDGRILGLLGPSGCGKTTTLRLIAGFERPDVGDIFVDGKRVNEAQPYERSVGLLFQDYALFPHMTVTENIGYGLKRRGWGQKHSRPSDRIDEMLDLVKLHGMETRYPAELSGGQQQRVALARALAVEPKVMLLDEPLSALDAKLRQELRIELKQILATVGSTAILVTHDQEEAMSMADTVMVMHRGRIVQVGRPSELYNSPATQFVAEFVGRSNWFAGTLGPVNADSVSTFRTDDGMELHVSNPRKLPPSRCDVCVRPERFSFADKATPSANSNRIEGGVIDSAILGADINIVVSLASGQSIAVSQKNIGQTLPGRGDSLKLIFDPSDCIVLPRETGDTME